MASLMFVNGFICRTSWTNAWCGDDFKANVRLFSGGDYYFLGFFWRDQLCLDWAILINLMGELPR